MEYFCSLELKKELMLNDPTVRWLIEKRTTLLDEKNLFSLIRVYEEVVFLRRLHIRQVWSRPGIPPFPPPTLPKAEVLPLKLHIIVRKVRNITLTHPLCYEVLET